MLFYPNVIFLHNKSPVWIFPRCLPFLRSVLENYLGPSGMCLNRAESRSHIWFPVSSLCRLQSDIVPNGAFRLSKFTVALLSKQEVQAHMLRLSVPDHSHLATRVLHMHSGPTIKEDPRRCACSDWHVTWAPDHQTPACSWSRLRRLKSCKFFTDHVLIRPFGTRLGPQQLQSV